MIDEAIHATYKALHGGIRWHDFREVGADEPYYDWYYAENRLYIIRDRLMEQYWFIQARSPLEALEKFKDRLNDVMTAGRME